jgi:hypothetical protein
VNSSIHTLLTSKNGPPSSKFFRNLAPSLPSLRNLKIDPEFLIKYENAFGFDPKPSWKCRGWQVNMPGTFFDSIFFKCIDNENCRILYIKLDTVSHGESRYFVCHKPQINRCTREEVHSALLNNICANTLYILCKDIKRLERQIFDTQQVEINF